MYEARYIIITLFLFIVLICSFIILNWGFLPEIAIGLFLTFISTLLFLAWELYKYKKEERERKTGLLKAIYLELREAKILLKDVYYEPSVLKHVPHLFSYSWEAAIASGIIDPSDPFFIKLRDVYRGFQLINENVYLAVNAALFSIRSDRNQIVNGMMKMIDRINSWLMPMLEECITELENKLQLTSEEIEKIEKELIKRKTKLIKIRSHEEKNI